MNAKTFCFSVILIFALSLQSSAQTEKTSSSVPDSWVDSTTGYTLVRLSCREGENTSFYFHNNPFIRSKDGMRDEMIYYGSTPLGRQLFKVDLESRVSTQLTNQPTPMSGEIVARKHREVIYQCGDTVYATHVDTRATRVLFVFPDTVQGTITTLNADETLLAGTYTIGNEKDSIIRHYPRKGEYMRRIYEAHILHFLFVIPLEKKELRVIHKEHEWINHVQFSPTDPEMLLYCHEGPWERVDRIWTINVRTGKTQLMHKRTMEREIAGHEFWSPDGKTIWFDLQMPRSQNFFLAGVSMATGEEVRYRLQRNEWSIHYTINPAQTLFAGDGADSAHVARGDDASWIYLFEPEGDHLKATKLVTMKHHKYHLEPNVHFSPNGEWIIFRSNMFGPTNIFAVKIHR